MNEDSCDWRVLPHGPIEKLSENLWRVEGSLTGMPLKRVMTVAKRSDEKLVIHNGIALDAAAMAEIEAWGKLTWLVVPNAFHRLDAGAYLKRYSQLNVLGPRGAIKAIEKKVTPVSDYESYPNDAEVSLGHLEGIGAGEGYMLVHSSDGATLVLNDSVFNMPHAPGFTGLVLRYVTGSSGGPRISNVFRWLMIKNRRQLRGHLERLAQTPRLVRIIVSHHELMAGPTVQAQLLAVAKQL